MTNTTEIEIIRERLRNQASMLNSAAETFASINVQSLTPMQIDELFQAFSRIVASLAQTTEEQLLALDQSIANSEEVQQKTASFEVLLNEIIGTNERLVEQLKKQSDGA
jgi:hypothetical protein